MPFRRLIKILILVAALGGAGCQNQQANQDNEKEIARARYEAGQAAYAFLESFAKPTPENAAAWGLTDLSIYGQPSVFNPAGAEERTPSPDGYRMVIPLWIKAKNSQGESVRLSRKLSLDVKRRGDSWTATN